MAICSCGSRSLRRGEDQFWMRKDYRVIWVTCCAPSFGGLRLAGERALLNELPKKLTFAKYV
jgi:hypothetical protein